MKSNFNIALKYVLKDEGGNDDDPRDHGGRTSRGITQRNYDAYRRLKAKPLADVWDASDKEVKDIYLEQYWNPYCDQLPSGLDYLFFDISVNAGRSQAVRQFQKALEVKVDGMMGQVTLESIINNDNPKKLIRTVSEVRRNFYRHLAQFPIYGKGWLNRVDHAEVGALALSDKDSVDKPSAPSPKASDDAPAKPSIPPEGSGTIAAGSGGLIEILHQFEESLAPYRGTIKYVTYALVGIAAVSFGYMLWGYYKRSKAQAAM